MNKFTKLLSVFAIASLVGAGTAAIAGCNSHEHEAVKHDAVAATCTTAGNIEYYTCAGEEGKYYSDKDCTTEITLEDTVVAAKGHASHKHDAVAAKCEEAGNTAYYTCDNACCAGKYYTDSACTTETTLEDTVVAATGHTYISKDVTPKDNANHKVTCENCTTQADQAHVDANGDDVCDSCNTTFMAGAYYYNSGSTLITVTFKADGKVGIKIATIDTIATAEEATGDVTITNTEGLLSTTFEDSTYSYTIEKKDGAYTLKYKGVSGGGLKTRALTAIPETYFDEVNAVADFKGVYEVEGGHVYYRALDERYYKLTSVMINEEAKIYITYTWVNKDGTTVEGAYPVTKEINAANSKVLYSTFSADEIKILAKDASLSQIVVTIGDSNAADSFALTSVVMTKSTTKTDAIVPSDMGIDTNTKFAGGGHIFKIVGDNYSYDGASLDIVGGNATSGYIITVNDAANCKISYLLKVSADGNTVTAYQTDGTTLIATLTKQEVVPTKLVTSAMDAAEPNYNNTSELAADDFNENFKYYEIPETGWYYFIGIASDVYDSNNVTVTLYPYANHTADNNNKIVTNCILPNKGVQFNKGDFVAISADAEDCYLAVLVSKTNIDNLFFEDFEEFDKSVHGTYSYSYENGNYPETVNFIIDENGISYYKQGSDGYVPDPSPLTVSAVNSGMYVLTAYGNSIVFTFNEKGNMSVTFDTVNDIDSAYVATKGGSSSGVTGTAVTLGENTITEFVEDYATLSFTADADANYTFKFTDIYEAFVAGVQVLADSEAKGEITIKLSADEAISVIVSPNWGKNAVGLEIIKVEVPKAGEGKNTVAIGMTGEGSIVLNKVGTWKVTFGEGVNRMFAGVGYNMEMITNGGTITVTDTPIEISVISNSETATFSLELIEGSGEELEEEEGGNAGKVDSVAITLGDNTITSESYGTDGEGNPVAYVSFTATKAGSYTFTFTNTYQAICDYEYANINGMTAEGSLTLTFEAGETKTIEVQVNNAELDVAINVAEKPIEVTALNAGDNTIGMAKFDAIEGVAYVSFTATEAGSYTFTFKNIYIIADTENDECSADGDWTTGEGKLENVAFTAGETKKFKVIINSSVEDVTINIAKA